MVVNILFKFKRAGFMEQGMLHTRIINYEDHSVFSRHNTTSSMIFLVFVCYYYSDGGEVQMLTVCIVFKQYICTGAYL
jgi:hypothetical protein